MPAAFRTVTDLGFSTQKMEAVTFSETWVAVTSRYSVIWQNKAFLFHRV